MKSNKGFTLIEMAVVLAIIAILAAILTPIVTSYIDQARLARASVDVDSISEAMLLHYRDTGKYAVWLSSTIANTGTTPSFDILVSGTSAVTGGFAAPAGSSHATGWSTATAGLLTQMLNTNSLGYAGPTTNAGAIAYRGPYLDGLSANDPWGNPYIVTSKYLATSGGNAADYAFTISAGPNGTLDTTYAQPHTGVFAAASDDIVSLIH